MAFTHVAHVAFTFKFRKGLCRCAGEVYVAGDAHNGVCMDQILCVCGCGGRLGRSVLELHDYHSQPSAQPLPTST